MTAAVWISLISLSVSVVTLYLVHLRRPSISCRIGPEILAYYADHNQGGSIGFYVPTTFINSSVRTGSILNLALSVHRVDLPEQRFFMMWRHFTKLDVEKNLWVYSESAHAVAVPGNSAINKMVWFMWFATSKPKFVLEKGSYKLHLHYWELKGSIPKTIEHSFFIGDNEFANLDGLRSKQLNSTFKIPLDKELEINRAMTNAEAKKLLGPVA